MVRLRTVVLAAICGVVTLSVGANVWLIARGVARQGIPQASHRALLKPGDVVREFEGRDTSGRAVRVEYEPHDLTILYVLSPHCEWCARNVENINSIAAQVKGRIQVIGISLTEDGLPEHLANAKYPFPVLVGLDPSIIDEYALGPTPHTIVIDESGRVGRVWLGAYSREGTRKDLEATLAVQLPPSPQKS